MVEIKIKKEKKRWVDERWKSKFVYLLKKNVKKKMGGPTVEIKNSIFTIEKGEKRWVDEWWKSKSTHLLENFEKKMGGRTVEMKRKNKRSKKIKKKIYATLVNRSRDSQIESFRRISSHPPRRCQSAQCQRQKQ